MKGAFSSMFTYDPSNLKSLIEKTGMSETKIAEAAGLSLASLRGALKPRSYAPSITTLGALADYFAVPLDFIAGRCDEETAKTILADYGRHFMELRRAPFESYLKGRKPKECTKYGDGECEAPWPYNLLDAVFKTPLLDELGIHTVADQGYEDDVLDILGTLRPREEVFILQHFRDGKTTGQIAKENNLTRSRVYEILHRGIRTLRHPSRSKILRYGSVVAAEMSEIATKQAELRVESAKLASLSAQLKKKRETLETIDEDDTTLDVLVLPTRDMDLSVRSYNCLMRRGLRTLGEVVECAREGGLLKIRNLGRHSLQEVLDKILELTGEDYSNLYQ